MFSSARKVDRFGKKPALVEACQRLPIMGKQAKRGWLDVIRGLTDPLRE